MANSDLKIGDRVRLSPNTRWYTSTIHGCVSNTNPLDCLGTVKRFSRIYIHVDWDNGTINEYRGSDDDLILVEINIDPSNITLSDTTW